MTQNSANPMKPCGIMNDWEPVYEVKEGKWYGWPDYYSGIPRTDPYWIIKGGEGTEFVLREEKHERLLLIPLSVRVSDSELMNLFKFKRKVVSVPKTQH